MTASKNIIKLYDRIYKIYRLFNFIITLGMDELWRKKAARFIFNFLKDKKDLRILDCACGCGDMTKHLKYFFPYSIIYGVDGNSNMLEIAKRRVFGVNFINSECSKLPFDDKYFDAVVVSFATRNLYYSNMSDEIFSEIKRVLKDNGFFFSLETDLPQNKFINKLFKIYISFIFFIIFLFLDKENKTAYLFLKNTVLNFSSKNLLNSFSDFNFYKINIFFNAVTLVVITRNKI